ncbi:MAG: hypothetical protein VX619_06815 [bacterium]|nr:hypothetical protein [bacterium]
MIRAKLCAVKPLIYCILLSHTLFSCLFAYQEQDLETLADKLQFDEKLDEADEKIINKLWQKYVSGNRLTLIEDDTVYKYEKWMNRDADLIASPVDSKWTAYDRFGKRGWQFVIEHQVKNGAIFELEDIDNPTTKPFFQWAPKTLKIVWETGPSMLTNINLYDMNTDLSKTVVNSAYKDFAPHFTPMEQFLLFLSNRDRKSRSDESYALYAINLENLSEILKLSVQKPFAKPTNGDPIINFDDRNSFDIQLVDGRKIKYKLDELVSSAREKIYEANKKRLAKLAQINKNRTSKIKQKSFELTLDQFVFKESSIKLVKELNNVVLKDVSSKSKDTKILMSTTLSRFNAIPGPLILPSEDKIFFIKLSNENKEIWQYEGYGREPKRVSPKGENCYGMQVDDNSNTLVYLLQRRNLYYLMVIDDQTSNTLNQYKISEPSLNHGEDLTKILNRNKVYFKDSEGNWKSPDMGSSIKSSKSNSKKNLELSFSAPHLPKISTYIKKSDNRSNRVKPISSNQNASTISSQIESLRKSIQWISTNEELEIVMSEYNQIHNRVTQKIRNFKDSSSFSQKRLKIRWIESLNGIRALLDNTKLLLEVE